MPSTRASSARGFFTELAKRTEGNAELDEKLFQIMRLFGLDSPEESVFETRMISVQNSSDSILLHQRSEVHRVECDHIFSVLAIVDWAVVPVVRAVDSPQSWLGRGASWKMTRNPKPLRLLAAAA